VSYIFDERVSDPVYMNILDVYGNFRASNNIQPLSHLCFADPRLSVCLRKIYIPSLTRSIPRKNEKLCVEKTAASADEYVFCNNVIEKAESSSK
jgi:hypothetical protein